MRSRPNADARRGGFTIIELLVAATIFILLLAALTGIFVNSSRAYRRTSDVSVAMQDAEAVLQLLRYEFALAGYYGLGSDHRPPAGTETLSIVRVGDSDEVTIRYVEDEYVAGTAEERVVTFRVDPTNRMLVRIEPGTLDQEMVANVAQLEVLGYIRRDRVVEPVESEICGGPCPMPQALAGVLLRVAFDNGAEWQFPVGLYNPQATGESE